MRAYFGPNIADIYEMILEDLQNDPDFVASPRGMEVKEIKDCTIEIENPMLNIYKNKHRSSKLRYIAAELLWYFSGTNNPKFIEQYASLWKHIHNPDDTVNSSYGNLIFNERIGTTFTQYQWVINSLKKDKDTRQAFMHFNKPHHQYEGNKDQVCTLQSLFHIRKNKLYMTITMRSNDVILGFMTDWAFFSVLQYHVYLHMKKYYPELKLGTYTHISHSMHLYEKHYEIVKKMIGTSYNEREVFDSDSLPLLSEPVVDEVGNILPKYKTILEPIKKGEKPDFNIKTGNELIDWCLNKLNN